MCLLNLSDQTGMIDVVIWSDLYTSVYSTLASSEGLKVTGLVKENYGVFSLVADTIEKVTFG